MLPVGWWRSNCYNASQNSVCIFHSSHYAWQRPLTMLDHGLLQGQPSPSVEFLTSWLKAHDVQVSDGVKIVPMDDGTGWRAVAARDLEPLEPSTLNEAPSSLTSVVKIPKSAILSTRTSSLPPLPTSIDSAATTSHTIFGLALALLHELRLGSDSKFWGYTQSLPRAIVPVPPLWPLAGSDAASASAWLQGTEASRDVRRRQLEGIGLVSLHPSLHPPHSSGPDPALHMLARPAALHSWWPCRSWRGQDCRGVTVPFGSSSSASFCLADQRIVLEIC